jgi:hypothetical protein
MAKDKLEKQIAEALKSYERWLRKQEPWKEGHLRSTSGRALSGNGPVILGEGDLALQLARRLADAGVSWKDLHLQVTPSQWLTDPKKLGARPAAIDLAIVDHIKLGKRKAPFSPGEQGDFLFDAVFEFRLADNSWDRKLASGRAAKPPARAAKSVTAASTKVRKYLDGMLARSGHVVVVEECDHGWDRGNGKPVDGLSVHYLRAF